MVTGQAELPMPHRVQSLASIRVRGAGDFEVKAGQQRPLPPGSAFDCHTLYLGKNEVRPLAKRFQHILRMLFH